MTKQELQAARGQLRDWLLDFLGPGLPGVAGVGLGADAIDQAPELIVLCNASPKVAAQLNAAIPTSFAGVPVRVERQRAASLHGEVA